MDESTVADALDASAEPAPPLPPAGGPPPSLAPPWQEKGRGGGRESAFNWAEREGDKKIKQS